MLKESERDPRPAVRAVSFGIFIYFSPLFFLFFLLLFFFFVQTGQTSRRRFQPVNNRE